MIEHNGIKIEIETIDPTYAKELLGRNDNNRNLRPGQVRTLTRVMSDGLWQFNGEPIRFAKDGTVIDGQHRLSAVIASNTTQDFVVETGFGPEVFATIDIGAKRTGADAIKTNGTEKNAYALAAIANGFLASKGVIGVSVTEVQQVMDRMGPQIHEAHSVSAAAGKELRSAKVLGVAALYLLNANRWAAAEFFDSLATGANLQLGDPRLTLRKKLMRGDVNMARNSSPADIRSLLNMIFRAWNAWREGRSLSAIYAKSESGLTSRQGLIERKR